MDPRTISIIVTAVTPFTIDTHISRTGTTVEYYDFAIFAYMATYMALLFFVSDDPTASLLGAFAVFAVAFFVRIPGGMFFGHIGDKYGRKTTSPLRRVLSLGVDYQSLDRFAREGSTSVGG
jgi:MFS family permease